MSESAEHAKQAADRSFEDIVIMINFMFSTVIQDPALHHDAPRDMGLSPFASMRIAPRSRMRNVEMQTNADKVFVQRCRLYQPHIDVSQLRCSGTAFNNRLEPSGAIFFRCNSGIRAMDGLRLDDCALKLCLNAAGRTGDICQSSASFGRR